MRTTPLAAVASLLATAPLPATEYTRFEWLWLEPERAQQAPEHELTRAGALLNLPPGWQAGEVAVVLAFDSSAWPAAARDPVIGALLAAGSAVLELDGNSRRVPRMPPIEGGRGEPANAISIGWQALQGGIGAGPIVVLGHGRWGEAALAVGGTYAAMGTVGPGRSEFRLGSTSVAAAERWEVRAARLCEALGWAQGAGATPVQAMAPNAALEPRCREGLLPGPRGVVALR